MKNLEILTPLLHTMLNILEAADKDNRFILGIAGAPASGKSTVSKWLSETINRRFEREIAIIVPMDGFHRYNEELERLGLRQLKGVPETFDAEKFINCLKSIRKDKQETIRCPEYDRTRSSDPIEEAIVVTPDHRVIIVEGNYLLMDIPPWRQVKPLLNESWYLSRSVEKTYPALIQRHMNGGMTREEAEAKVASTDLPNSALVKQTKHRADKVIEL